jgi:hypothetical protein
MILILLAISDEYDDFDDNFIDFTDYAAVLYLWKHLEQKPGLNELVVRKLDNNIAIESGDGAKQEMKSRNSVLSIISSAGKKRRRCDLGEALLKLANNQGQLDMDKAQMEVMEPKEEEKTIN